MTRQYNSLDGVPQRLITQFEWSVGQVDVDIDRGVVRLPFDSSESHVVRLPTGGLLSQFLRLGDDPLPAQPLTRFARRYGLLGLCRHGLPMSWPHEEGCGEPRTEENYWAEDLADWRIWARRFRALPVAADLLRSKDRIRNVTDVPATFEKLSPAFEGLSYWKSEARMTLDAEPTMKNPKGWVRRRRNLLCRWLNHLLLTGNVRRAVVPQLPDWNLELRDGPSGGWPLFGSLVLEAVSDAIGGVRQVQCKGCNQTFDPTSSSARYCDACRARGAPVLRAQRARRERLHDRGLSTRGRPLKS